MNLFIPPLGTVIELTQDWHFDLYNESRNETLLQQVLGVDPPEVHKHFRGIIYDILRKEGYDPSIIDKRNSSTEKLTPEEEQLYEDVRWEYFRLSRGQASMPSSLPAGTKLKMDRIYIRKGQGDFDSVTFLLVGGKTKKAVTKATRPKYRLATPAEQAEFDKINPRMYMHGNRYVADGTEEYEIKYPAKGIRFWVKLEDANKILCNVVPAEVRAAK